MHVVQATPGTGSALALPIRAAVEDVCELEIARAGGQAAGDGRTDGAETEKCNPTAGTQVSSSPPAASRAGIGT